MAEQEAVEHRFGCGLCGTEQCQYRWALVGALAAAGKIDAEAAGGLLADVDKRARYSGEGVTA